MKTIDIDEAIKQYRTKADMTEAHENLVSGIKLQKQFVTDFPKSEIGSLTLKNYLISKKDGAGFEGSFCRRLRYEMDVMGHMGNVWFNAFGVYLKNGTEIALSDSLTKKYGTDYEKAFVYVKNEIKALFRAFDSRDYDRIKGVDLHKSFKYRLLMVYYPNEIFPVCTEPTLDGYCDITGIAYTPKEEPIYRNMELVELKKNTPQIKDWTNFETMLLFDWMWRNDLALGTTQSIINTPKRNSEIKDKRKRVVFEMSDRLGLECRLLPYENQITLKNDRNRIVCMIRPSKDFFQLMSNKEFPDSEYHSGWRIKYGARLATIDDVEKIIVNDILPQFTKLDDSFEDKRTQNPNDFEEDITEPDLFLEADLIDEEVSNLGVEGSFREVVVKQRVNQSVFRKRLLKRYKHCCLCNVSNVSLLRASHIKPWSVSSPEEKVDVNNGLLLCPNHDALFDQGYISFDSEGGIIVSEKMSDVDRVYMNVSAEMRLSLTEEQRGYMEYHRNNVFDRHYLVKDVDE